MDQGAGQHEPECYEEEQEDEGAGACWYSSKRPRKGVVFSRWDRGRSHRGLLLGECSRFSSSCWWALLTSTPVLQTLCKMEQRLPVFDQIEGDLAKTLHNHPQFAPESAGREELCSVLKVSFVFADELSSGR